MTEDAYRNEPGSPSAQGRSPGATSTAQAQRPVAERRDVVERPVGASPMVAAPDRRDRVRWGTIFAGLVVALATYVLLQLLLIATGIIDLTTAENSDAVWSAAAALVAFVLGGITAGASARRRGIDDGLLHGVVLWALALVAIITFSAIGGGAILGTIDTDEAFNQFTEEGFTSDDPAMVAAAGEDAQEAAGWATLGIVSALAAAAVGGVIGAKMWPGRRDEQDEMIDLRDRLEPHSAGARGERW